ncbi:MAG: sulfotransferase [Candidatus Hodarchaeota archaeon]
MTMEQIVFLTYISRSGSTFLARLLNEYEGIAVSIEARMPDGILYESFEIRGPEDVEKGLEILYSDGKFNAWNIDKQVLKKEICTLPFPIGYEQLLRTTLRLSSRNPSAKILVYKNGFYIKHIEAVKTKFPEAKFIFILRDARAIYNSRKASLNSETLEPMADNPIPVAKEYKQVSLIVDRYKDVDWLHVIKYEDLIRNTDSEIKRLLAFLGTGRKKNLIDRDYVEKIPEREIHLHTNVKLGPLRKRIDAWRGELNNAEIMAIQRISGEMLRRNGYELLHLEEVSLRDRIVYFGYWRAYYLSILRFIIELAIKRWRLKGSDFYEMSHAEAQLKQFRNALRRKGKSIIKRLGILS